MTASTVTTQPTSPIFKTSVFASVILLAFLLQIFFFSPLSSPGFVDVPPLASKILADTPWNNQLQKVIKLGEGNVYKSEDIRFDEEGTLYAATRDGWIKKMYRNGTWEDWMHTESDALLGLAPSSTNPGHVLVCDVHNGLIDVSKEEGVKVLASHTVNGSVIRFADDLVEASDGKVYFSDASKKFVLDDWYLDLLEAKPHGRILVYDPTSKETSVVFDGLYFPNGVALSMDEEYLVTCETWKYRCLKYYLKGEKNGKTEILVENLPGGPDNVRVAPDGTFWIACLELRLTGLAFAHTSTIAKHVVATFPKLIELTKGIYKKAMVVNVGTDGKIIRKFDDFNGKVMSYVTSAVEFEDHLYIGSLTANFVGKLPLM